MNAPDDLAVRLSDALQDLDDGLEIMGAMFDLDDLEHNLEHDDASACDVARVALRESVTGRLQRAVAVLKALAHDLDPNIVMGRKAISASDAEWLRRALDGLGR